MTPNIKQRIEQIKNSEIPKGYKHSKVGIIPEDWEVIRLKDKFDRLSRKNSEGNTNVLTISAQYGLINQEEFFKKEIASDDKSNYYLLLRGEFAYNKSYSNGYPFGAIKRLSLYDKGVVSPLYVCFSANADNSCPKFYEQYFEAGRMNHEIKAIAQEGARNHGLLNISVTDFFNSMILIPPIEEQQRIADILFAQDKVIECYEKKIEQLKQMKKYYLQNMFPKRGEKFPKIRFKGFTNSWKYCKLSELVLIERGGSPRPIENYITDSPNGLNWVKIGDAPAQGKVITKTSERIKPEGLSKTRRVQPGDLILSNSMSFGKPYIMGINGCIHDGWVLIRDTQHHFDLKYLCHMLGTNQTLNQYRRFAAGSAVNNLNKQLVGNTKVYLPPIKEQQAIGAFIDSLDNYINIHQRKLTEEYKKKKALQQLLLTGIVRVKL